MLYAATRSSLLKSLGSTFFTDSLFATSRSDLTPEAYVSHRRSQTAPKPLSTREQELAHLRAAETPNYQGSRVRASHVGTGVGLKWSDEVTHAARELLGGTGPGVLIIVGTFREIYIYFPCRDFAFRKSTRLQKC